MEHALPALADRDTELDRIRRFLTRAAEGRGGALVVEGPAGIGKTALLEAARDAAGGRGFRVLRARGAELEREFAFGVVRQLVEPLLSGASDAERASLLDGPPGLAARILALPGAAGGDGETAPAAPAAPDPSFAVLHGLYWLVANLAARSPVALVVDDGHWADGASLRLLAFLLPRLEELRVAVLMGARPAETDTEDLLSTVIVDPAAEVVRPGPLTLDGVARLVAAGLRSEPDADFVAVCREASGGVPFLVRTLVAALAEHGIAPVAASAARVPGVATDTVGRWGLIQLRRLGSEAARLARAVAVLERGDLVDVTALSGLEPAEAADAAERLVRAGVLVEGPLAFAHALLRAGVYREIPAADRAEAHRRAADVLARRGAGGERVAEHLLASEHKGDPWVVEQLQAAAAVASASGAPESAAAYLRRALSEPPPPEARTGVLLDLGQTELSARQPGWETHLTAALNAATDDPTRLAAAQHLATGLFYGRRTAEATEMLDRAIASLDGNDPEARLTLEGIAVVLGMYDAATVPRMVRRARAFILLAEERSVPPRFAAAAAYHAALANEPADTAAELARRAILGPVAASQRSSAHWMWTVFAVRTLFLTERYADAQELLDPAVAEARLTANGLLLPWLLSLRAWVALRRGDLIAAESDARALLESDQLSAPLVWRQGATATHVLALVERGELDTAERALEQWDADMHGTEREAAILRHARGCLRVAQRRAAEAVDDFLAAGGIATRITAVSPCLMAWRSDAALAQLSLGDSEAAQRLSSEELELARAFRAPRALGVALRAAGLVTGGRTGEALLREAVEVLDGSAARLEQARVRADLGALLRRSNRRSEARELLREAVDVAHRVGARPLASYAETELRATGAKPRRMLLSGLEALSASERRIAELAAEGLSNAQIAQALFVTVRTVEGHLTSVFAKLDVGRRAQLSAALGAPTQAVRA